MLGLAVRISPLARDWPFSVLGRKPDVPEDFMGFYVDRLTSHLATNDHERKISGHTDKIPRSSLATDNPSPGATQKIFVRKLQI